MYVMSGNTALKIKKEAPSLKIEKQYDGAVCGVDEVGRGPLAGPVLASCVYIPKTMYRRRFLHEINDSKKLNVKKREALFLQIRKHCSFGIGMASHEEVDTLNIHHATLLAMRRAYLNLQNDFEVRPEMALIDGKFTPDLSCSCKAIIKGDSISTSIAAASIMAKVTRDRIMERLHQEHPYYGWDHNSGYGTPEHLNGIKAHGITPYHRQSFAPVKNAL